MADKYSRFLERIAQLESSDGANLEHPPATKGVNKGTSAIGRYGIMPQTALEVLRRVGDKGAEMTPEEVSQKLAADPMFEEKIARALAARVIEQHGGNEEKAAFSWLMGHNLDSSQISDEDLEKSDYVKKFKETKIPSDVDYRDEPQVNPPRQEKGLLERARDAASGVMDKISALPDEAQRQNNAMVAAVLTKADPSLSREQALEKAARMSDLASQAGMMSGGITEVQNMAKAARKMVADNGRLISRDIIKNASRGQDFELPAKAATEEAKDALARIKKMRDPMQPSKAAIVEVDAIGFPKAMSENYVPPSPSVRGDKSYERMMNRAPELVEEFGSAPAAADVEAQLAALRKIRGR